MPHPPSPDLHAWERSAAQIVRQVAHALVRPSFGGPLADHHWATETQVHTHADEQAGAALEAALAARFPGHGLIVEDREPVPGDGRHVWYVDPIDGSANHLRGIPYVAVTVGLTLDDVPVVGVVHDLIRDVTLSASRGNGARALVEGQLTEIRIAATERLSDAMLIAHLARRGPLLGRPDALQRMLWNVRKIRCMGSIALDLALLATGEADLLVVGRGKPQRMLDILGGLVVLEEAGGKVCTASGDPVSPATRTLVAGPPALCDAFVELMAGDDLESWTSDLAAAPDDAR